MELHSAVLAFEWFAVTELNVQKSLFFFAGLSIVITILFRFLAGIIVYVIIFAVAGAAIVGIALTW